MHVKFSGPEILIPESILKMPLRKKILLITVLILLAAITYNFLYGRLLPFSPIILGFEKKEFGKAIIYYHKGIDITKFSTIDSLMNEAENFHQLKFKTKVKIFFLNSDKEYARYTGQKARFVTFPLYGRIFVSGRARKEYEGGKIHLLVYLQHELSHSLLFQNMSLYRSQYYPGWLLEGTATYNANQMGVDEYLTKEQAFSKIREGYFLNPDDWSTTLLRPQNKSVKNFPLPNKFVFIYSEFAYLVDDIIKNYGKERFLLYLTALLKEKDDKRVFQQIFGIEFKQYLDDFKNRIRANRE